MSNISEDLRNSVKNLNAAHHNNSINEILTSQQQTSQKESQIEQNNKKYFERKMQDRRKRTYEVLKQFDCELADFILDDSQKGGDVAEAKPKRVFSEEEAAVLIQAVFRGFTQRKKYGKKLQ